MTIKLKAKTFGPVFAFFDASDVVQYASTEINERTPHPPSETPVDMLLASLAYCMIKSAEWAAQNKGASLLPFSVKVTGTKASDLPGRVKFLEITFIGKLVEDAATARQVAKLAKNICTVSNTLNCEISVTTELAEG